MDTLHDKELQGLPHGQESQKHYSVPEGYFDSLSERIMQALPAEEAPAPPQSTLWMRLRPIAYLAASFVGIYLGYQAMVYLAPAGSFSPTASRAEQVSHQAEINDEEYVDYYMEYGQLVANQDDEYALSNLRFNTRL